MCHLSAPKTVIPYYRKKTLGESFLVLKSILQVVAIDNRKENWIGN